MPISKKPKVAFLLVFLTPLFSVLAQPLSDAELAKVRDDFTRRRDRWMAPLAGKPFRPGRKNPPLAPGRPEYVRGYAWSVTDFAMKTFLLGEAPGPANAALTELFQYFSRNRDARNDSDNFSFIQSARESGVVEIRKGQRALHLDFNQP